MGKGVEGGCSLQIAIEREWVGLAGRVTYQQYAALVYSRMAVRVQD
jgi:hypothetical protein